MTTNWAKWVSLALVCGSLGVAVVFASRNGAAKTETQASTAMGESHAASHKQLWHCGMHPQVVREEPGECPICHMALTPIDSSAGASNSNKKKILYWWDPMLGPSSISDHPGKSAMGMDLVPVYGDQSGPGVSIDPRVVQNMGVRTATVTRGPLSKTVRAVGLLNLPEPGMHDIALKVGGWIDKLYADQDGMHVNAGEPLFELYSQDLQVAEQELISAVKSRQSLGKDASPNLRQEAQGLIDSTKRKLRLWDVAEQDIDAIAKSSEPPKDVPFRSPTTGHIEDKVIVQGSAVQPMMKLMRVSDHTKMWLDAQVYQDQIPVVKIGQEVVVTVGGLPGQSWKGTITFIYPHLDHMTRTLTVRMTLDNPDFELKPGMYATAQIITRPLPDAIQVPREAVINTGTRQIAFVSEGEGHFSPRKVKVGLAGDDGNVQVVEGLAPGETVVTSGQFLMDVESRTIEATQKLGAPTMSDASAVQPSPPSNMQPVPTTASKEPPSEMPQSMPAMTENDPSPAASRPTDTQPIARTELAVAYCPMVKANWLQVGDAIANPYMGQQMSTCGTVQRKVSVPSSDDALTSLVHFYLDVGKALNADRFDAAALRSLNSAATKLQGDRYGPLRESAAKLAAAKDLPAARAAFHTFSDHLMALLNQ
jgi:Cu(I)/Ag(I) efflux system membrane fusion protein/cobalt-zinc-cadmium efflux system membrane fusion protein